MRDSDLNKHALKELGLQRQPHGGLLPGTKIGRLGGLARAGQPSQLGKLFRRLTREVLTEKDIQDLIRKRVVAELRGDLGQDGKPVDVKVTPVLMKIAGGQYYQKKEEGPQFYAPTIHLHLEKLTDQELEDYATKGIRPPALMNALEPAKDVEED